MAKDIDWPMIRSRYVTGTMSYRGLAKELGLSYSNITERGKAEGWPALRQAFREEASQRAIDNEIDNEAERLGAIIRAANAMSIVIEGVFADSEQFHRHLVQDKRIDDDGGMDIVTVEKCFDKVDSRAIKDLTGALKDMTLVLRNLYHLPTQAEAEAQRIASERLKLEQSKAARDDGGNKRIIIELGDLEELAE